MAKPPSVIKEEKNIYTV